MRVVPVLTKFILRTITFLLQRHGYQDISKKKKNKKSNFANRKVKMNSLKMKMNKTMSQRNVKEWLLIVK